MRQSNVGARDGAYWRVCIYDTKVLARAVCNVAMHGQWSAYAFESKWVDW